MLQRSLAWLILLATAGLTIHAFAVDRPFAQSVWTSHGLCHLAGYLAVFAGLSAAILLLQPRWYSAILAGLGIVYSCYAVGPIAVLAVFYILLSAYSAGRLILRKIPRPTSTTHLLTLLTGLCAYLVWFLLTLRFPIHYPWVYGVLLAVPVWLAFRYGLFPVLVAPTGPEERRDAWPLALLWMPLLANWLLALKPEVSEEGLARHLVFAAHLANEHFWAFDVQKFTWAVFPTGGESMFGLAYLLGGEAAARLLNFALLALMCWMLHERIHARVPGWIAALLAGGLATLPLTQMLTGSLSIENWVAAYMLGAVLMLRLHKKERRSIYAWVSAALAGAACACNLAGFVFLVPFYVAFASMTRPSAWIPGALLALSIGLFPYLDAMLRTANPIFPYFNNFFRSQFYETLKAFRDSPFHEEFSYRTLYDLTFHSRRFSAGSDGAFGYTWFLLLPVAIAGVKRRWPRTGFVLLWTVPAGALLTLLIAPELRNLYPLMPLSILLIGISIGSYRVHSYGLGRTLGWFAVAAYTLNFALFPAAGALHRDFVFGPFFSNAEVDAYVAAHAPERRLIEALKKRQPVSGVAVLESANTGAYAGRVFTNSWRTPGFSQRLYESSNAESLDILASEVNLDYFVASKETDARHLTIVPSREFLDRYTVPVTSFGDAELRLWKSPEPGTAPPEQGYAGPGRHDDLDPAIHFQGRWARFVNQPKAYRGTFVHTNDMSSHLEIRFEGRSIRLLYAAAPNRCKAVLSFSYGTPLDFDEYAERTQWQAVSRTFEAPTPGKNILVLKIESAGGALNAFAPCHVDLDGFIVE
jgi:hypothetical protein